MEIIKLLNTIGDSPYIWVVYMLLTIYYCISHAMLNSKSIELANNKINQFHNSSIPKTTKIKKDFFEVYSYRTYSKSLLAADIVTIFVCIYAFSEFGLNVMLLSLLTIGALGVKVLYYWKLKNGYKNLHFLAENYFKKGN